MKKIRFFAIITAIAAIASCSKIKQLANINADVPYSTQVTIPPYTADTTGLSQLGGVTISLPGVAVPTNSKQFMSDYHTAANMVINVYLKSLSIRILSPAGRNFDFMDNADLYLSAAGQPEVLIASRKNIPKGSSILNLTTNTDVNLKIYFVQDTIYFRLSTHINTVPPADEELNISSVFHVLANPLY